MVATEALYYSLVILRCQEDSMDRIWGSDHDVPDLCFPLCTLEASAEYKNPMRL